MAASQENSQVREAKFGQLGPEIQAYVQKHAPDIEIPKPAEETVPVGARAPTADEYDPFADD